MLYDGNKIIPGLIIFLGLLFSPVLYNFVTGQGTATPNLVLGTNEKQCIEPTEYMRTSHMQLLTTWREEVVRDGQRTYTTSDGKTYDMSLTKTCLKCHQDKAQFCDNCHNYAEVAPNCFDCHVAPEVKQQ